MTRTHHQAGFAKAVAFLLAVIAICCLGGCSGRTSVYGDYSDSKRGTCSATGTGTRTTLSHGGWVTDCGEGLPE